MEDNVFFIIIIFTLATSYLQEFGEIQKNFKYRIIKGYLYVITIPLLISYITYSGLINTLNQITSHHNLLKSLILLIIAIIAKYISNQFFNFRENKLKFKKFSESWLMNRFYSDLVFSILIGIPGIIHFMIEILFQYTNQVHLEGVLG